MNRHVIAALMLLCAAAPGAAGSDLVLAPDGPLYRIAPSAGGLTLTVMTNGAAATETVIPGARGEASLAYDPTSASLFVAYANGDDVMIATFRNGGWAGEPVRVARETGNASRIRIAITQEAETAPGRWMRATSLHVFWWERNDHWDGARYALASVDGGTIAGVSAHHLGALCGVTLSTTPDENKGAIRQIVILESSDPRLVDVLFSDTKALYRVRLKPYADHRIRIPIGVRPREHPLPHLTGLSDAKASAVSTRDEEIVLYLTEGGTLRYAIFDGGQWSATRVVRLPGEGSAISAETLVRKMIDFR